MSELSMEAYAPVPSHPGLSSTYKHSTADISSQKFLPCIHSATKFH